MVDRQKMIKRQDEWVKQNREKITITMPIGTRARVAEVTDMSLNQFFREAMELYIEQLKTGK